MRASQADAGAPRWPRRLFLAMIFVGGVAGYYSYQRWKVEDGRVENGPGDRKVEQPVAETPPRLSPTECLRAVRLKDVSIGHLENGPLEVPVGDSTVNGLLLAADGFAELVEMLPHEELPRRNLAIARLLLLENALENTAQLKQEARQAAQDLIALDQESIAGRWLLAKVEMHLDASDPLGISDDSRATAIASLQAATKLEPDRAFLWLALYQAYSEPGSSTANDLARQALAAAYQAAPRNLYLITEWLMVQASAEDPGIAATLTESREVLLPLAASIQQRARLDIGATIDQALAAVEEGNWQAVPGQIRRVQFTVRPEEVAKSDLTRVDIHPLELLQYDFGPEFQTVCELPELDVRAESGVTLVPRTARGLDELSDIRAIKLADIDLNGRRDLVVLQPGQLRVMANPGSAALQDDSGSWAEMLAVEVPEGMTGILVADLDRDRGRRATGAGGGRGPIAEPSSEFHQVIAEGTACFEAFPDVVVYGPDGVVVLQNQFDDAAGRQAFTRVEQAELAALRDVHAGLMVDIDHDGDLDLVFSSAEGITLWQSTGNFQFRDVTRWSVLPPAEQAPTVMQAVDWDRDVDIDLVLGGPDGAPAGFLENLCHGQFRWVGLDQAYQPLSHAVDLAVLEADGNVSWDLLTAGPQGVQLIRTATPRAGTVKFLAVDQLTEQPQTGILTWDFDNDGFRDAVAWGPAGLTVFRGGPEGSFTRAELLDAPIAEPVRMVVQADLDRDGDEDLVVAYEDRVGLLMNEGGNKNRWIAVSPMGRADNRGRCNQGAIGSLVELRFDGHYRAQVVEDEVIHFGLGPQGEADLLRIVWTNGVPQDVVQPDGNVAICEKMTLKGSCPYIYTLVDGQFEFLTDCLWAAPLGMVTSTGSVMPTREWEYLRIPGDRLTPLDGSYWIQLTEELWEAGYFDYVELIAVDHPADVEVYSNEKVGPAEIAEFHLHTVRDRQFPVTARDSQGRDVREQLRHRDGQFVKAFARRFQQGLTEPHFIELDLGTLESPQQITLFLTGWIFPTDTSLNVSFLQDPEIEGPFLPSVWVVNEQGDWQETIPFMGFPGGKTKTIAVDLSEAFLTDDYRVRIQTTAEIYWDEVFFTVDETPVDLRLTSCTLESADLQYRGYSQPLPHVPNAPQVYDHSETTTEPMWPPMRGKFTRYGCVHELLARPDDMMAVIGAGDAITIRFRVPDQDPPPGWQRTFILHSIGWDKDADLNTIYGQTVEPLPFRAMTRYPYGPEDPVPESPEYRDYLRKYQTREQNPSQFWRRLHTLP